MNKSDAISKLQQQINALRTVKATARFGPNFSKWQRNTRVALLNIFPENKEAAKDFDDIQYHLPIFTDATPESVHDSAYIRGIEQAEAFLESCICEIEEYWGDDTLSKNANQTDPCLIIEKVCSRFHSVVRQLSIRHDKRETIHIKDEYDLQDLLHALLRIFFDDIRPEEWTPSYAGKSSRMDFLLKDFGIVVETKMSRKGLGAKEVGTQLIDDIARYKHHQDCHILICFVYDPEDLINNPSGLEKDLTCEQNDLNVKVIIAPKWH